MASNEIPKAYTPLIQLMEDAADGANTHGATVGTGLKQNTEAVIRIDLEALTGVEGGPPGLKSLANAAATVKSNMTASLRTACSNGRALAMACIGTLKPALGTKWNSAWTAVGFSDSSLAVPANPMVKLQLLRDYYATNPTREVANVNGIACTAAACNTAALAISTASSDSNQSNTDAGTAQSNFEKGIATARRRMTGLRDELSQLIGVDDERWYAFGFDKPSDPSTPEIPENLTVTAGAPGSHLLLVNWDDARRAEGYRTIVTNVATGAEVANQLSQDSESVISGLPAGMTVSVTVSARNAAGESQASAAVQIVVP